MLIRGTRHDDTLYGSDGDRVNAFAGSDTVYLDGGENTVQLGRGNDEVWNPAATGGKVWGGVGNDSIWWFGKGEALVGGKGDDFVLAADGSNSYGDEGPGRAPRTVGNDHLQTEATSAGGVSTQTGGHGADWHIFTAQFDFLGGASACVVTDFQADFDKVGMALGYATPEGVGAGYLSSSSIWGIFDTNGDGVLNGTDVPWDGNSGTAVVDGSLHLRLHEDTLVLQGVTSITAADWLFV